MAYQSKTWSLSDEVVAEIDRRVREMIESTGAGSPNRVLKDLLLPRKATLVNRLTGEKELEVNLDAPAHLDTAGPELSSGKGEAALRKHLTTQVDVPCKCGTVNKVRADQVQFECSQCGITNYAREGRWDDLPPAKGKATVETRGIRPKGDLKR